MRCPKCNHEWKLPGPQAGGRARVKKGFADPRVQAKAQASRKRKARDQQNDQISGDTPPDTVDDDGTPRRTLDEKS